uniref:FHA domain-containing protein n=1 Tax=Meloidogyne incognita TaxID=6306 RepID=A0A914M1A6_MELIC
MGRSPNSSSHSRRKRSRSRERYSRERSRSRERSPKTSRRRSDRDSRRDEDHYEHRSKHHSHSNRKFVRMDPPPGGWDKPSWEPSGALKKEIKNEEEEEQPSFNNSKKKEEEREKPSFEPSGKLAQDTNTFKGVVVKYNEPPEAKIPKLRWRIYPFKAHNLSTISKLGEESLPVIYVHRQSAYLIGRDHKVADFPIDHPSCSKQHAALQYRSMPFERADGSKGRRTRPYIIDLGSGNGTFLNGERIEAQRYYQLKEKDVLKFGFSSREYVMLHEQSLKGGEESDTSEGEEEDDVGDIIERSQEDEERIAAAEEDDLF